MNSSRIRDLRKAEGWTQERLADSSGVAVRTIQRIEAGDEGSFETLTALARTLSVPVKDLFTDLDDNTLAAAIDRLDRHNTEHREAELQREQQHRAMLRRVLIVVAIFLGAIALLIIGLAATGLAAWSTSDSTTETTFPVPAAT